MAFNVCLLIRLVCYILLFVVDICCYETSYMCNSNGKIYNNLYQMLLGGFSGGSPSYCSMPPINDMNQLKDYLTLMNNLKQRITAESVVKKGGWSIFNDNFFQNIKDLIDSGVDQSNGVDYDVCIKSAIKRYDSGRFLNLEIRTTDSVQDSLPDQEIVPTLFLKKLGIVMTYEVQGGSLSTDYDFEVFSNNMIAWKSLKLDSSSYNVSKANCLDIGTDKLYCGNKMHDISSDIVGDLLEVKKNTLFNVDTQTNLEGVVEINVKNKHVKLRYGDSYAFLTEGCRLPKLKIKVEWIKKVQEKQGALLTWAQVSSPDSIGSFECYERKISIIEITTSDQEYTCQNTVNINAVRYYLQPRNAAGFDIYSQFMKSKFAIAKDNRNKYFMYSKSAVAQLIDCASQTIATQWKGVTDKNPGMCTKCDNTNTKRYNIKAKFCDFSNENERFSTCCYGCRDGYIETTSNSALTCIKGCAKGFKFTGTYCARCPDGTYSEGGNSTSCLTCAQLGIPNSILMNGIGCVRCGNKQLVVNNRCVSCSANEYVPVGRSSCESCPRNLAYYLPSSGTKFDEMFSCLLCPAGSKGDGNYGCLACEDNTYSDYSGSSACINCPTGKYSFPNKTGCLDCPALSSNLSEYYSSGCDNVRCKSSIAYAIGNVFTASGCALCSSLNISMFTIGTYRSINDCSKSEACTNKPSVNAYYSEAAPLGSTLCGWDCMPGYFKNGNTCAACQVVNFKTELHEWTSSCSYDCKPFKYRDGTKTCNVDCVNLLKEALDGNIKSRISFYGNGSDVSFTRPNYVLGVCGVDDAKASQHEVALLRHGIYAWKGGNAVCGNLVLNTGEECDDGNAVSGDGCSTLCKIETDKYWDCDEIGVPCKLNCGWSVNGLGTWDIGLYGYVLPACPGGKCSCKGLEYYNVKRISAGERSKWMSKYFVECNCDGNLNRMVPYEECTYSNRGCKECPENMYFHDLRKECIQCGTQCLTQYQPISISYKSKCSNSSEYRFSDIFLSLGTTNNITQQQLYIGCEPCDLTNIVEKSVRFLPNSNGQFCKFQCFRDTTGTFTDDDSYCVGQVDAVTGACQSCFKCSYDLSRKLLSKTMEESRGFYLKGCMDVVGYEWRNCDQMNLPANAEWRSRTAAELNDIVKIQDPMQCPWECKVGYYQYENTRCLKLFSFDGEEYNSTRHPCPQTSDALVETGNNLFYCAPCQGVLPFLYQVWKSKPPLYNQCLLDCEEGVSWKNVNDTLSDDYMCMLCTPRSCVLGEFFRACTSTSDSECVSCDGLGVNHEYYNIGTCNQRCQANFYKSGNQCLPCDIECDLGYAPSTTCVQETERNVAPVCVSCPPLGMNERFVQTKSCSTECKVNFVNVSNNNNASSNNGTQWMCVLCDVQLCGNGYYGSCFNVNVLNYLQRTELKCILCNETYADFVYDPNSFYPSNGSCHTQCKSGYKMGIFGLCEMESLSSAGGTDPTYVNSEEDALSYDMNFFGIEFPMRKNAHS